MLEIGNDFRHCGLGHSEVQRRLSHASALYDREEGLKVAKPKVPADLDFRVDPSGHMGPVISVERI